ncbi:unnamed protein product [Trichobilharzia szidati]|nr:unnamed protein product [Trichobilharzia szidati]
MLDLRSGNVIRVGSRRSTLALLQTQMAIDLLVKLNLGLEFKVVEMTTVGDRILNVELSKIGDKSLFTKELEKALLDEEVDFVVHSLKDVPTALPDGLVLGCIFTRSSPEDVVLMAPHNRGLKLRDLPVGSIVGTSAVRRVATLSRQYPHLNFVSVRGNLNTRLAKLDGVWTPHNDETCTRIQTVKYDAIILAKAGVDRMGWSDRIDEVLSTSFYAVSQGALACECRRHDSFILDLLSRIHNESAALTSISERSLMRQLDGGCSIPISVRSYFTSEGNREHFKLTLHANILSVDGIKSVEESASVIFPETMSVDSNCETDVNPNKHKHNGEGNMSIKENNMKLISSPSEHELKEASDPSSMYMGVLVTPISDIARLRMAIAQSLGCAVGNNLLTAGGDKILHEIRSKCSGPHKST